jgi:hypothetical protein
MEGKVYFYLSQCYNVSKAKERGVSKNGYEKIAEFCTVQL